MKKFLFSFFLTAFLGLGLFFGITGCSNDDRMDVDASAVSVDSRRLGDIPFRDMMRNVAYTKEEIDALIEQIYNDFRNSLDPTAVRTNTVELVTQKIVMRTNIVEKVLETYEVNNVTNQYTDYHYDVTHTTNNIYEYYNVYTTNNITTLIDTTNLVTELHVITNQYVDILTNYYFHAVATNDWPMPPFDWGGYDTNTWTIENGVIYADDTLTVISDNAFANRTDLVGVICSNVTSVGKNAFSGCSNLEFVDLPRITTIQESTFKNCSKLHAVNIPSVTTIGSSAFEKGLYNVNMENFNAPSLVSVGNRAFFQSGLNEFCSDTVRSIGVAAFAKSANLQRIILPECDSASKTSLLPGGATVGNSSPSLRNEVFNDLTIYNDCIYSEWSVTDNRSYDDWLISCADSLYGAQFAQCSNLKFVELPKAKDITGFMFYQCSSLDNICISNAVDVRAFSLKNTGIKDIYLPAVTTFGDRCLAGSSLTNLVFYQSSPFVIYTILGCGSTSYRPTTPYDYIKDPCTALETIFIQSSDLASSNTSFKRLRLGQCTNLKHIFLNCTISQAQSVYSQWNMPSGQTITIHCSDGSVIY